MKGRAWWGQGERRVGMCRRSEEDKGQGMVMTERGENRNASDAGRGQRTAYGDERERGKGKEWRDMKGMGERK